MESKITSKNLIVGELKFNENDVVLVKEARVSFKDQIVEIVPVTISNNIASFNFIVKDYMETGLYIVVWVAEIYGKEVTLVDEFLISTDNIDKTLPLELQHLV